MPPKASSSNTKTNGPTQQELEAINAYLAQKPDFEKIIVEAKQQFTGPSQPAREPSEYDRKLYESIKKSIEDTKTKTSEGVAKEEQDSAAKRFVTMPVQPKEEEAPSNITDQVAKESKDSTASTHELHTKATVQDHQANPGPVMAQNLGEPASKEELKKRAEELNK